MISYFIIIYVILNYDFSPTRRRPNCIGLTSQKKSLQNAGYQQKHDSKVSSNIAHVPYVSENPECYVS